MLTHLHIQNIGLIEQCEVDFLSGFTIITGETGAGKSMLIDALSLALGARADTSLIRQGEKKAMVEVCFSFSENLKNSPIYKTLEEYGLGLENGELILRRMLQTEKSRAFINGAQVTQAQLKSVAEFLVDIHGQHDQQLILRPAKHVSMLDKFGRLSKECGAVKKAYQAWFLTHKALEDAKILLKSRADEEILLNAYIEELEGLGLEEGEELKLIEERKFLMSGEKLVTSLNDTRRILSVDTDISDILGQAEAAMAGASEVSDEMGALYERLVNISHEASALVSDIENTGSTLDISPERLTFVDDRLFTLKDCAGKHETTISELPKTLEAFKVRQEKLGALQEDMSALEKEEQEKRSSFESTCALLTSTRKKASKALSVDVEKTLKNLEMPHTKFEAALQPLEVENWGKNGAEKVEFMVSTNVGSAMAPLVKIASGGEVSRLMLALKQVFYKDMLETTLIFDEIDTGVGGSVAEAMGLAMKDLSKKHQVFSITHLAQVAAKGHRHVKIVKTTENNKTKTQLIELDETTRLGEVSRMLSGKNVTAEAKAAAASLLAS